MTHKEQLKQLLAKGKIAQAIKELLEATKLNGQEELHSQIILQSGRYHDNENPKNKGLVGD